MSGRAESRDVSAIRVVAAPESRREESTASLSHRIMRDDHRVIITSANRRLTELAKTGAPHHDAAIGTTPHALIRRPPAPGRVVGGALLGGSYCARHRDDRTHVGAASIEGG